jgi:DNA polymerase-3 subunit delta'
LRFGIESGRPAQSYILEAPPRGAGRELAEQVLSLLFCEAGKKPCNACRPCRQARAHSHPDVLWVEPETRSRRIAIEKVRDLQRLVYETSFAGGWRACVIVGADRLTDDAANAFLRTLEEPPPRCLFLLLTDSPQALLPTVVSRSQAVAVSVPVEPLRADWWEAIRGALTQAGAEAAFSGDSVFPAQAKADCVNRLLKRIRDEIEKEEGEEEIVDARLREARTAVMRQMLLWYGDILALRCGAGDAIVFHQAERDFLRAKAARLSVRQCLRNVEAVAQMNRHMEANLPDGVALSLGFREIR